MDKVTEQIEEVEIVEKVRMAKCVYGCKDSVKPSTSKWLPFFEAHPEKEYDHYYCGCWGFN